MRMNDVDSGRSWVASVVLVGVTLRKVLGLRSRCALRCVGMRSRTR